jgi:hypothetical protein
MIIKTDTMEITRINDTKVKLKTKYSGHKYVQVSNRHCPSKLYHISKTLTVVHKKI